MVDERFFFLDVSLMSQINLFNIFLVIIYSCSTWCLFYISMWYKFTKLHVVGAINKYFRGSDLWALSIWLWWWRRAMQWRISTEYCKRKHSTRQCGVLLDGSRYNCQCEKAKSAGPSWFSDCYQAYIATGYFQPSFFLSFNIFSFTFSLIWRYPHQNLVSITFRQLLAHFMKRHC